MSSAKAWAFFLHMEITLDQQSVPRSQPPCVALPPRMRVLYVTSYQRTGSWLADALASQRESKVLLEEAVGGAAGMERLRDELFDAVLISHDPPELDGLDLVEGIRTGGGDEPLILLGAASEQEMIAPAFQAGASDYVCAGASSSRMLIWTVARAIERTHIARENQRLLESGRQRIAQEHEEASRLLAQQRTLLGNLEALCRLHDLESASDSPAASLQRETIYSARGVTPRLMAQLTEHYTELLRAYVIMGSGNLAEELGVLAELLASAGVPARQVMLMHLDVLDDVMRGLGSRSARHVLNRANLLVLEVMLYLAEGYRRRLHETRNPPRQRWLPGFASE